MASLRIARLIVYPASKCQYVICISKEIRARAKSCALHNRFSIFGLETNIQFEMVNISIELFGGFGDLAPGIPLFETGIC